jgi:hypothetical protein
MDNMNTYLVLSNMNNMFYYYYQKMYIIVAKKFKSAYSYCPNYKFHFK